MALSTTFGTLTAATGGELDTNFAEVGALGTQVCTATGTNSIALTPAANQPALGGYGLPNPTKFGFIAPATTTGNVTLEVLSFGFLQVYLPNGVQASTGILTSGNYYEVTYTTGAIYNSGNGAWVLSSYQPGTGLVVLGGSLARGLSITNSSGTPNTQISMSFQQACLVSVGGTPVYVGSSSTTIDLTTGTVTSTANGMDGESRPASGWVYIYAISTGSGMAGLGSNVSPLAGPPTLPSGYAYYAYLGAMCTDGSSNLLRTLQLGSSAQYVVTASTNTAVPPVIASGALGTFSLTSPVYFQQSVAAFMPPTAGQIRLLVVNDYKNATISNVLIAPDATNYGGTNNGPLGSNGLLPILYISNLVGSQSVSLTMVQEQTAQNIGIVFSTAGGAIAALGWIDYTSAAG